ncbi:MAG: ABC transporter permease, partial [Pyrobaculum sp.]
MWPIVGMAAAAVVGVVVGLIHGLVSTYLNGNQIISGVAINLFAAGAVAYIIEAYWGVAGYKQVLEWARGNPFTTA